MVDAGNETPQWPNVVNPGSDADYPGDFIDAEPSSSAWMGLELIQGWRRSPRDLLFALPVRGRGEGFMGRVQVHVSGPGTRVRYEWGKQARC